MKKYSEASMVVNGRTLSQSESITIRVALTSYLEKINEDSLGDDEHGEIMKNLYSENITSILNTILTN